MIKLDTKYDKIRGVEFDLDKKAMKRKASIRNKTLVEFYFHRK